MTNFFLHLTLVLLVFFPSSIAAQYIDNINCPNFLCNGVTISYPFWKIGDPTATKCGYRGFGINCTTIDDREIPTIHIGNDSYFVQEISYHPNSLVLIDYDVSPAANVLSSCPRVCHNINMETLPLNFTGPNINLSFHFNCTGSPSFAKPIPCMDFGVKRSFVNNITTQREDSDWNAYSCESEVVKTVLDYSMIQALHDLSREFSQVLSRGCKLTWGRTDDCKKCEDVDGRCGHNKDSNEIMCLCGDGSWSTGKCKGVVEKWIAISGVVSIFLLFLVPIFIIYCLRKFSSTTMSLLKPKSEDDKNVEAFVKQYGSLAPKRYNYTEIKKMTSSFKEKLGQGGYGSVFKGKLSDGRLVAVKLLNSTKANGQEFINEVASIGRTSHVNIVTLLGFCFEYRKRALIYDYMANGSLEKFVYSCGAPFKTGEQIGVDRLYEITLGIARGLDYLHRGCNTCILHLDIKPHNILLDEDFCPKISDFGLAKLYSRKDSIVSMLEARGTIGYIAPEIFNRNFGRVSHKSDVYSYGMLVLEMIGGREKIEVGVDSRQSSEIYFPYWIYKRLKKDEFILDVVTNVQENEYARKLMIVGLWCIQADPKQRPSINEVIDMLEGSLEALEVPPEPFFSSPAVRSSISTFRRTVSLQ